MCSKWKRRDLSHFSSDAHQLTRRNCDFVQEVCTHPCSAAAPQRRSCNINDVSMAKKKKKASGHNTAVHSNIFKYLEVESRFPTQISTDKELFQMLNCAGFTDHPLLPSVFNLKSGVEDIFKSCVVKLVITAMHHTEHHLPFVGVSEV